MTGDKRSLSSTTIEDADSAAERIQLACAVPETLRFAEAVQRVESTKASIQWRFARSPTTIRRRHPAMEGESGFSTAMEASRVVFLYDHRPAR
ncbi:hypothetical protein ACOJBO_36890 [Rhizobium beringeri]